jgi:putative iron-regulated protein
MRLLGSPSNFGPVAIAFVMATLLAACGDDGGASIDAAPVNEAYATNVYASYSESLTKAQALKTAIDAFIAAPSQTTLDAAKAAWIAAREPYGQTEVYRFYDGPIDNAEDGPEGQINAWPLDEVFIDYVQNMPNAGIINNTQQFPAISKQLIADQNENGGEANISSGYHAIEFLLWGQDLLEDNNPGARPFTDYTTLANADRRKQYLAAATELLIDDLTAVKDAWAPGADYRVEFEAGGTDSVQKMLLGMGSLAGAELSGERMTVALDNRDQEDEHSCFSDNTHADLRGNALGIQNVFLGTFGSTDGQGIEDLVRARDSALADRLKAEIAASLTAIDAIPKPFDRAIDDDANGRPKVMAAIAALQKQTETTVEAAEVLGLTINLE